MWCVEHHVEHKRNEMMVLRRYARECNTKVHTYKPAIIVNGNTEHIYIYIYIYAMAACGKVVLSSCLRLFALNLGRPGPEGDSRERKKVNSGAGKSRRTKCQDFPSKWDT